MQNTQAGIIIGLINYLSMKYFFLNKRIDDQSEELIDFINSNEGDIKIFIDSQGGCVHTRRMLVSVINENKNRITLEANGYLFSSAFILFFSVKCKRVLHKECIGMMHLQGLEYRILENGKPQMQVDKYLLKQDKDILLSTIDFMEKIGIEERYVSKVKKGEDVYFNFEQMQAFIN